MRPAFVVIALSTVVAGCAGSASPVTQPSTTPTKPRPVRTIVRGAHVVHPGQAVRLDAQRGVAIRLRATGPKLSRTQLSSSHGYPPAHGYYVTFHVTVVNLGHKPVGISPDDFATVVQGQGRVTSYEGNAPYSGGARQLDPTELAPGDSVRAPLTFDVSRPHGRFGYYPDRTAAIVWVY